MPRYFFDLTNGDSVIDEVGEEFDLVEEARGHAVAMARELCATGARRGAANDRATGPAVLWPRRPAPMSRRSMAD
jgi:hypothetical protein